jgi:SAM-dependent methyltransferase
MDELRTEMFQMGIGYWWSKALYSAARANVADELERGPRRVEDLAAKAKVHPESLHRVLRALASVGVFEETEPGTFRSTPKSEYLRASHPQSLKHSVIMVNDDLFDAWVDFHHAVETGRSAIDKRFGSDFFRQIASDPEKSRIFDRAMQEIHGGETALMLEHFDFSRHDTVLDVGGGNGSTLRGILEAHPAARGVLFDLPQVVEHARSVLAEHAVASRIDFRPGDFFEEIPGRADCIVLRHVLHDWDDERSARILANARRALTEGGSLLVVEKVITPGNEPGFVKLLDLNMMAIGGKERTEAQYRRLLEQAGLTFRTVHGTPGPIDVVEAHA